MSSLATTSPPGSLSLLAVVTALLAVTGCVDVAVEQDSCESDTDCVAGAYCQSHRCILPVCGNGEPERGEECDAGPDNGPTAPCGPDCLEAKCGDGRTQAGEECDLGDPLNGPEASCTESCTRAPCGDAVKQDGEECDLGTVLNLGPYGGCTEHCALASCGDGEQAPGEECDQGLANGQPGSDCSLRCTTPRCGDGSRDPGESCDDGNSAAGDGCSAACQHEDPCRARAIWGGVHQTYALREDGAVVTWGRDDLGALGLRPGEPAAVNQYVLGPERFLFDEPRTIGAGLRFGAALLEDGRIFSWGDSENGTLGGGILGSSRVPYLVPAPAEGFRSLSVGRQFVLAIDGAGLLWGWGNNAGDPLGETPEGLRECRAGFECVQSPVRLDFASGSWRSVAAGGAHVIGLGDDFRVHTWGAAGAGQLGRRGVPATCKEDRRWPAFERSDSEPVAIPEIDLAREVWAGYDVTFVLDATGGLWGVGSNCTGELGLPELGPVGIAFRIELPDAATATSWEQRQVVRVSAGSFDHVVLINAAGEAFGAGRANLGQLGHREGPDGVLPATATWGRIPLPEGTKVVDAFAGNDHTALLTDDGRVLTFGGNVGGSLGDGTPGSLSDLTPYPDPREVDLCP